MNLTLPIFSNPAPTKNLLMTCMPGRKVICNLVMLFCITMTSVYAQQKTNVNNLSQHKPINVNKTSNKGREAAKGEVNFTELANYLLAHPEPIIRKEPENEEDEERPSHTHIPDASLIHRRTPVLHTSHESYGPHSAYLPVSPPATDTFESTIDNAMYIPPDTHGAVDSNYCVTAINGTVHIQTRTGANVSSVTLNAFYSSVYSGTDAFDPRVHYDPYTHRWFIISVADAFASTSSILIAISKTSNPTGSWWTYKVTADGTGVSWLDYPDVGFNKKWIGVTGNLFGNTTGGYNGAKIFVFNKANLLAGISASYTSFIQTGAFTICPAITYDTTETSLFAAESWNGAYGYMNIWKITGAVGSESMSDVGFPVSSQLWAGSAYSGAGVDGFAPQLGSTHHIQANDDRVTQCIFMNGKLWFAHTIFLPYSTVATDTPTRSSIQWWQTDTLANPIQIGVIDDSIGHNFYAFPSIAVNTNNDALIGFSAFSATTYPSAAYALRYSTDPTDSIRPLQIFRHGQNSYYKTYGATRNRWGDYSGTMVDPLNMTNFWTIQEASASAVNTWDTWWANIEVCPSIGAVTGTFTVCAGSTITLADTTSGGIWSSSNTSVATVSGTGIVTGVTTGTTTISYTVTNSCSTTSMTAVVTVNPLPAGITGTMAICAGSTTPLSDLTAGGTWSSTNTTVAAISSTGVVTGSTAGTTTISYTIITACGPAAATAVLTVNVFPSAGTISGTTLVTAGFTTSLTDAIAGGSWSTSNFSIATVGSTGIVTGVAAGTSIISYTVTNSCGSAFATKIVTVVSCTAIITTIAGTGSGASSGDGGPAISAGMAPHGVQTDSAGNLYIADAPNNRIRKISTTGIITTIAGTGVGGFGGDGGPATSAQLSYPQSVTIDRYNNIYICDGNNNRIRKINTAGVITTIAGTGVAGHTGDGGAATAAKLNDPYGLAIDTAGNIYIADCYNSCIRKINTAGIISTFTAPSATPGFSGDGGPVSSALVSYPTGVFVDTNGNVYINDSYNNRIRKVNVAGIITTIVGSGTTGTTLGSYTGSYSGDGGPATSATINTPNYSCFDKYGNIYIADYANNRVRKVNTAGIISTIAGNGTAGFSGDGGLATSAKLFDPSGIAFDPNGNMYITDYGNDRVREVTNVLSAPLVDSINGTTLVGVGSNITLLDGITGGTWSSGSTAIATVGSTSGVVTGISPGTATITYTVTNSCGSSYAITVVTVTSCTAIITTIAGNGTAGHTGDGGLATAALLNTPDGIVLVGNTLYIGEVGSNCVRKIDLTTGIITAFAGTSVYGYSGDGGPALSAKLSNVYGLAVDSSNNIYIADQGNNVVRKVDNAGIITTFAGTGVSGFSGDGGPATAAKFANINGVATDKYGNVYIADQGNYCVRKVNTAGIVTTIAGIPTSPGSSGDGGPATAAKFQLLPGVYVDNNTGNIYVPDFYNNKLRVINTAGIINTIAGTGVSGYTGDGGPATSAKCYGPLGVWVDGYNNVVFNDVNNNVIRKINPAGIISTIVGTGAAGYSGDGGLPTAAKLQRATQLLEDGNGHLYICDYANNVIRKVTFPPSAITGIGIICTGTTTTLIDSIGGGVWTSGSIGIATVGSTTGIVTGLSAGTAAISYTANGCTVTTTVTVDACGGFCNSLSVPDSIHLCLGDTATINATLAGTDSVYNYTWSPATGLSSTTILDPVVTATTSGWYHLTVNSLIPGNLVVNGDFSAGATGFSTSYTLEGYGIVSTPGDYAVGTNPYLYDNVWPVMGDHTTGTGNMLIVDGAAISTETFWCETIPVIPNTNYVFTVWTTLFYLPQPSIQLKINGVNISTFTTSATTALWQKYQITWNSGTATTAGICMNDLATGASGNDFGVDDISFQQVCVSKDSTYVQVGAATGITGTLAVCQGATTSLSDITPGGTWSSSNPGIASAGSTGIVTGVSAGTATITYTLSAGCITTVVVTVNPLPVAGTISGTLIVCPTASTTLSDPTGTTGGVWSSTTTSVATVSTAGVVTGVAAGTTTISYTISNSCGTVAATAVVTINPNPFAGAISGTLTLCTTASTTLSDPTGTTGGVWSSTTTSVATVSTSGVVTGVTAGTSKISYTVTNSCGTAAATAVVTVNTTPVAGTVSGTFTLCPTANTTLSDPTGTAGGVWSSTVISVATISTAGVVTGVAAGTTTISYTVTNSCGTVAATAVVTINPAPNAGSVSGTFTLCPTTSTTLSDPAAGGIWSSTITSVATVSTAGVVTGVAAGTTIISYTVTNSCGTVAATAIVTVNPLLNAGAISGTLTLCPATTTTLSDPTGSAGGVWSSTTTSIATVSTSGMVTGVAAGTTIISYTVSNSCGTFAATAVVTVNPNPNAGAITGLFTVCTGTSTNLTDAATGGVWSSTATGVAIVSSTGMVTGVTAGTTTISYTVTNSCGTAAVTAVVTVIQTLVAGTISGTLILCPATTITLSDPSGSAGGVWSSTITSVAVISTSGVVTGVAAGTTTISYTVSNSCGTFAATAVVTVNPNPNAGSISGASTVCPATSITLTDAATGGVWSSTATSIATVGSTGVVTGVAAGTTIISYTVTNSCGTVAATKVITVNPNPVAGVISGTFTVCPAASIILSDPTGTPGGVWSSTTTSIATISATGVVTGVAAGTTTISYLVAMTCGTVAATAVVTVNPDPVAGVITGPHTVCAGASINLTDPATGGNWSSTATSIATVNTSGVVTGIMAGTTVISYTVTNSCGTVAATIPVTVNPTPVAGAISGVLFVCPAATITLSDPTGTAGGTWSSTATSIAIVNTSGVVTGIAAGTTTISYTVATVCGTVAATVVVTVNPDPVAGAITGIFSVCPGTSTNLTDPATGGAWSSTAISIATISTTGTVTGVAAGTATISYTVTNSCGTVAATAVITVNKNPNAGAITGILTGCPGTITLLGDPSGDAGGTWSSTVTGIATISTSGVVTGIAAGTTTISYTVTNVCGTAAATAVVTINPDPVAGFITGTFSMCPTISIPLTDPAPGGIWSSTIPGIATVNTAGIVTGVAAGTTTISYTVTNSCGTVAASAIVTVDPAPFAGMITGTSQICPSTSVTLTDPAPGGIWSSTATGIATISTSGVVSGIFTGTTIISYTVTNICGTVDATKEVTINPLPLTGVITGNVPVCAGSAISLNDTLESGTWASSTTSIASVSTAGIVTGTAAGTARITYTLATGCYTSIVVTVLPLPAVYALTGGGSYCAGGSGVHIGLTGSDVGVSYLLYYGPSVTGYLAGTGTPLDFGLLTAAGNYTVRATNNITGCTSDMFGSEVVTIIPTVNPAVSISTGMGDTVCPGTTVTLTPANIIGGTPATYKWSVNGVLVSLDSIYTYIPANGDIISVTMTSSEACVIPQTATDTLRIHVIPDANPLVGISIYPGDTICQYAAATFTATPTFGGSSPTYIWYVNGLTTGSSGSIFSYYPATGDVVYCKMLSDYPCRLSDTGYSNVATMTVAPMVIPHVDVISKLGFDIMEGAFDTLTTIVANAGPDPTYQWEINGLPVYGATSSTFISQFNNYDSVTCVLTSSGVCEGISTFGWIFITVHQLGVQQYNLGSDIQLIPNPNKGVFNIRGTLRTVTDEEVSIEITDMIGQVIYRSKVSSQNRKLDEEIQLSNTIANGMYLLALKSESDSRVFHFVIAR